MTDPGAWTTAQNEVTGVDLILITHEHPDHLHVESLETVLKNNPGAKVITNTSVGKIIAEKGIAFDIVEEGGTSEFETILLESFGSHHQEIFGELGMVQNTGYFIDNTLFYPGDAFTDPQKPVEILALPIAAPWMTFKMGMEYALLIKPKYCFPVHEGMLHPDRVGPIFRLPPMIFEGKNIAFIPLRAGDSHDF